MAACKGKMNRLKKDFEVLLSGMVQEGKMLEAHRNGMLSLIHEAKKLAKDKDLQADPAKMEKIGLQFQDCWDQAIENLSGDERIDELGWTNCENLSKTFRSVNRLMSEISY